MKTVVQVGRPLSREQLQKFLAQIPKSWTKGIASVNVLVCLDPDLKVTFHSKEQTLCLHVSEVTKLTEEDLLLELAVAFQLVQDFGHIPSRVPSSRRSAYEDNWRNSN